MQATAGLLRYGMQMGLGSLAPIIPGFSLRPFLFFSFLQMGLGKTAQSISTLEFQRQLCDIPGPFLIVAPLTTLGHWQREVETWTSMVSHHLSQS